MQGFLLNFYYYCVFGNLDELSCSYYTAFAVQLLLGFKNGTLIQICKLCIILKEVVSKETVVLRRGGSSIQKFLNKTKNFCMYYIDSLVGT